MHLFCLPEHFLIGTASAATQVEGGDKNNSWYDWYQKGGIKDGSDPSVSCDYWNRWESDIDLMRDMGLQICRMGVEWSRIEPEEGVFDESAIERYIQMLERLNEYGIRPLLTLHHFTNPMWFEKRGGWTQDGSVDTFLAFVDHAARAFAPYCSEYITINEPNVYAVNGYFFGSWPPGEKSMKKLSIVLKNMTEAHVRAYGLIHAIRIEQGFDDTLVSFANHVRVFVPYKKYNLIYILGAKLMDKLFQRDISRAMMLGKRSLLIPAHVKRGEYCDFIGVNYYSRSAVRGFSDGFLPNVPVNDLDWEIYPRGIIESSAWLFRLLPRPIFITENGTCDNADAFRARYICEHLEEISASGLPIERYYHWCFTDNFEWAEGNSARFGVVYTDFKTQRRTVKKSGKFLSEVIKEQGVTEQIYAAYCRAAYRVK